ncbi:MAG: hypothetical protein MJD61_10210 [Proteobacteria bacterium]|nr:hypothetical protein [Pseudomonadota bacterium]
MLAIGRLIAVWCVLASGGGVRAQSVDKQVADLNERSIQAYLASEVNLAGATLEEALRIAAQGGVKASTLARTHLHLGIVYVGGLREAENGLPYLIQALCLDPDIELDRFFRTTSISRAFETAKAEIEAGACADFVSPQEAERGVVAGVDPAAESSEPAASSADRQGVGQGIITHVPPREQESQVPLPLYVELAEDGTGSAGDLESLRLFLFYKSSDMKEFQRVKMRKIGRGYGYQLACEDVWEPGVSYYIAAFGDNGEMVGSAGSQHQPLRVQVVSKRLGPAPAFPGLPPPTGCGECPPGVACEGGGPGQGALGDACASNADCRGGLYCSDNLCAPRASDERLRASGNAGRVFVRAGMTVGSVWMKAGMLADRGPPIDANTGLPAIPVFTTDRMGVAPGPGVETRFADVAGLESPWVPDSDSFVGTPGGSLTPYASSECPADGVQTASGDANPGLRYPSRYCVRVNTPGFVAVLAMRAALGVWLSDRVALEGIVRLQLEAGRGTMANMLAGGRLEYLLSRSRPTGLLFSTFFGATGGQIQARAPTSRGNAQTPFAISGMFGLHTGFSARYRLGSAFALHFTPELDLQLPAFMLVVDATAGLELTF